MRISSRSFLLKSFQALWVLSAVLLLGVSGCRQEAERREAVYPVDGQLLYDGSPAQGALITFHPAGEGWPDLVMTAEVRADGHFVPVQPDGAVGLPEGKYAVTFIWERNGEDRFTGRYAAPSRAILEVDVKPTINLLPPIRISKDAEDTP